MVFQNRHGWRWFHTVARFELRSNLVVEQCTRMYTAQQAIFKRRWRGVFTKPLLKILDVFLSFFLPKCLLMRYIRGMTIHQNMRKKPDIRERLLECGVERLSDTDLLAVLLHTGIANKPVTKLAEEIIQHIDTRKTESIEAALKTVNGIGAAKLSTILAAFELGRRYYGIGGEKVQHPSDIVPFLRHYSVRKQEHFICASLNGAHEILATRVVSVGTLTHTLVHPREVFADPLADRAAAVILAHNHPSGSLMPSAEDLNLTNRLCEAGRLLGIDVLDHIILSPTGEYMSFIEAGVPLV